MITGYNLEFSNQIWWRFDTMMFSYERTNGIWWHQVPCHIWFENWQANFKIPSSTARELWGTKSWLKTVDNTMRWHLKQPYRLNGSRCGETGFGRSVSGHHQLHSVSLLLEESDGLLLRHALIQRNPVNRKNLIILLQSSIPEDKNEHSLTCQSKYP